MWKFIKKLLFGNEKIQLNHKNIWYKRHKEKLKKVWNNEDYQDFGIERIFRLFLIVIQYIFPGLFIREMVGKKGFYYEKIWIEIYIIWKLILFLILLYCGFVNIFTLILAMYLLAETVCYLLGYFFLKDVKYRPISYKRSIFLIFINYIEVILYFATFYSFLNPLNKELSWPTEAIYYSIVTSSAVWYGELYPISTIWQIFVIFEVIIFLLFVIVFFSMNIKGSKKQLIYKGKIK